MRSVFRRVVLAVAVAFGLGATASAVAAGCYICNYEQSGGMWMCDMHGSPVLFTECTLGAPVLDPDNSCGDCMGDV